MTLPLAEVHPRPEILADVLAREILEALALAERDGRTFLLGCPSGRTPKPIYDAMAARLAASQQPLTPLVLVMMDEFMSGEEGDELCPPDAHYSCRRYAEIEIRQVLNASLSDPSAHLDADRVWFPDPRDPPSYDRRVTRAGGVDLFLMAMGATDGHAAFNPPGSKPDEASRVLRLADETRHDNLGTFPGFGSIDEVPTRGVTVGLGTIASLSRSVAMVVTGAHKRAALNRLLASNDFDAAWPATILHHCSKARILVDEAAGGSA